MAFLWIAVAAIGIIAFYRSRDADEEWLALKLIGYYVLGAFHIDINGFVLPAGFLVTLLLLARPKANRGVKRGAAIFGLILMIIGILIT